MKLNEATVECVDGLLKSESGKRATLAQLVERLIRNQQVAGSIPAGGSIVSITYTDATVVQNAE